MKSFETAEEWYRKRIWYRAEDLMDRMIYDHLLKGGEYNLQKITRMFATSVQIAQLVVDLEIGTGLHPVEKFEKDEEENDGEKSETACPSSGLQTFTPDRRELDAHCRSTCPNQFDIQLNEVSDLGEGNPEGPPGCVGNEKRVCDTGGGSNPADDNRTTGGGKIDAAEQQSVPAEPGCGEGRGHSG